MLLILAEYPDTKTQHEGMSQRVMAIDRLCAVHRRVYLFVSHRRFWIKELRQLGENAIQYRCNSVAHATFINSLFRQADICYFHSVINVLPLLPFLSTIPRHTSVILDAHGVVPEESRFAGSKVKSRMYGIAERIVFRRVDKLISVSDAMTGHFREKYPRWSGPAMTYPILPSHIGIDSDVSTGGESDTGEIVNVVYSGNLQSWQNIELMLSLISQHRGSRMRFWILTGQREAMLRRVAAIGMATDKRLSVITVAPQELQRYYRIAHYGFVLREDMVINRVSCPTKLVEYLQAGIIPIVLTPKIGDFEEMGYEYLRYTDFSANLPARKSEHNRLLMGRYIHDVRAVNFAQLIACD